MKPSTSAFHDGSLRRHQHRPRIALHRLAELERTRQQCDRQDRSPPPPPHAQDFTFSCAPGVEPSQ